MKKLTAVVAALVMALTMAGSAHASWWTWPSNDVTIKNDDLFVMTKTEATAQTGGNDQWSLAKWNGDVSQYMTTGTAIADVFGGVSVGTVKFPSCGCLEGDVKVENEDLKVMTFTDATAKTGGNDQWSVANSWASDSVQSMVSGNAGSYADSNVIVAFTDFSVSMPE